MSAPPIPERATLPNLREAVQRCRACEALQGTTQAGLRRGPGQGGGDVRGRAAGDREDREGQPFVGPARRTFNKALVEAGIDRKLVYVTNTVKHFHFEERGKRRIHQRPRAEHIAACRPWLEAELAVVKPRVLVCLGAVQRGARRPAGEGHQGSRHAARSELAPVVTVTCTVPRSCVRATTRPARRPTAVCRRPRGGREPHRVVPPHADRLLPLQRHGCFTTWARKVLPGSEARAPG